MMRDPIHPGETLREDLDALGMSAAELARRIEVPSQPHHRNPQWPAGRHRRHGAASWALLRDVGGVLAQPPEALRVAACGAEERRGNRASALSGVRQPGAGFGVRTDVRRRMRRPAVPCSQSMCGVARVLTLHLREIFLPE